MFRRIAQLCLIYLVALASAARAQSGAPNSVAPAGVSAAALAPSGAARPGSAPAALAPPELAGALPGGSLIPELLPGGGAQPAAWLPEEVQAAQPVNVSVPSDPATARWGNFGQPAPAPTFLPGVDYTLVGPPRGWIQPNAAPEYRAVVTAPQSVPDNDLQLDQVIDLNRPDGMAPSGVFGAVTLPAGRILMSYTYLQNSFDNNFVGTHQVSTASVLAQFRYAPTRSLQDSQVATIAYAVTDDLTITGSLPFQHNEIDYTQLSGSNLRTDFTNPGDIRLSALYVLRRAEREQWHVNLGVSFPVGLLETLTDMPSPVIPNLPYQLRTSSGTYDLIPGLTYRGQSDRWSWGMQANGTIRLGFNTLDYKLGDQAEVTGWLSRRWTERISTSSRFDSSIWGNIGGQDGRLNTTLAPTNGTVYQAGRRINLLCGLNYYLPATRVPGQYFSVEGGLPAYQSLAGPQLGLNWILNASWTMVW